MTTAGTDLAVLGTLGWMLDEEIVCLPHVLRALVLSADGLVVTASKDMDQDMADRAAAAVTGMQAVSRQAAEFADSKDAKGKSTVGPWEMTLNQYKNGFLIVMAAGAGTYLTVSATREADIESVSFSMEKVIDRIGEKLGLAPRQLAAPSAS
ncbi:roadblock/LC7 domain-containing protein [Streptomyces sp. S1D4-20]|uniref:roadblock/LC7 domain-containing protein n=1 Tax=Streptomyces sp. S1D4-20 TaxID=2594462 RepID=UPI001162F2CF|nr:roadblock/LC7 domain-containing protein [Streptomyces sp. S1D4-20]QDN54246.1 roadblock/LC7 domain-containing protein [Streptomyces sp. S1D4-20]